MGFITVVGIVSVLACFVVLLLCVGFLIVFFVFVGISAVMLNVRMGSQFWGVVFVCFILGAVVVSFVLSFFKLKITSIFN